VNFVEVKKAYSEYKKYSSVAFSSSPCSQKNILVNNPGYLICISELEEYVTHRLFPKIHIPCIGFRDELVGRIAANYEQD